MQGPYLFWRAWEGINILFPKLFIFFILSIDLKITAELVVDAVFFSSVGIFSDLQGLVYAPSTKELSEYSS